jgi:hypothetical protein
MPAGTICTSEGNAWQVATSGTVRDHAGTACHPESDSFICYGRARLLDDLPERAAALNAFSRHYRPDAPAVSAERVACCMAVEVTITEMTGRRCGGAGKRERRGGRRSQTAGVEIEPRDVVDIPRFLT